MEFATIGSALSRRRKSLNIDQARAAAIIGMSRTTFSSYERDLQRPSAEVLPSLALFLDISIDDILTLYGGTCIEALRPSLERYLAAHDMDATVRPTVQYVESTTPVSSDIPVAPAPDLAASISSGSPVAAHPALASKDASVSIFANELSDDVPRATASSSQPADPAHQVPKATKGKDGKKKKGKKGKRAKS